MNLLKRDLLTRQQIVDVYSCLIHDWGQDVINHHRPSDVRRKEGTWNQLSRIYEKAKSISYYSTWKHIKPNYDMTYDTLTPRQKWYYHYLEVKWGLVIIKTQDDYALFALSEEEGKAGNFCVGVRKAKSYSPAWIQSLRHQGIIKTHDKFLELMRNCTYREASNYAQAIAFECAFFYKGQAEGTYDYVRVANDIGDEEIYDIWHTHEGQERRVALNIPYPTVEKLCNVLKREREDWRTYLPYSAKPLNELYLTKAHEPLLVLEPTESDLVLPQSVVDHILSDTRRSDVQNQMSLWILDMLVAHGYEDVKDMEKYHSHILLKYLNGFKAHLNVIDRLIGS